MKRLFGTDGVRGVANVGLTAELSFKLGQVSAHVLLARNTAPKIIIGTDTRISCDTLKHAFVAGACSVGANVVSLGILPTPGVAHLTKYLNADLGVVISASHNSFEFNGIKFFNKDGYKISDADEERIECIVLDGAEHISIAGSRKIGTYSEMQDAGDLYCEFLKSTIDTKSIGKMKIALDCSNGAAYRIAPLLFEQLGAQVHAMNISPNGTNINENCGSTHVHELQRFVIECGADVGFAFDGDADRVMAVDENGGIIDGDKIMSIIALDLKRKNELKNNTAVVTVMSNLGFSAMAKECDINVVKTVVGDRYVLAEMLQNDYVIGGEQSGHIIMLKYNTTGDGILTALQLANIMRTTKQKISELGGIMQNFPQVLRNVRVSSQGKDVFRINSSIAEKIEELESKLGDNGRVLVRQSGTEPLIRIMIEGRDIDEISREAEVLARVVEESLD